jgi:hypothetical protein
MKATLESNKTRGFSTIELLIAAAILLVVITGALQANLSLQYWRLTTELAHEALFIAKGNYEYLATTAMFDFFGATSTHSSGRYKINSECTADATCYFAETNITDVSSCVKELAHIISWRFSGGYPTSTIPYQSSLFNLSENILVGGDCVQQVPKGVWSSIGVVSDTAGLPQFTTGVDNFDTTLFVVSSSSPQLRVYRPPEHVGEEAVLLSSATGTSKRLNAIDVNRDVSSGRAYAFVMQHTNTNQLGVFDVTKKEEPTWVTEVALFGVPSSGSFPQGWRVLAYGNRLYVVTRETAGAELHIMNISNPRTPIEITAAATNLGRTVNDMAIREQWVDGVFKRFLFLAASAATKELEVLDVTNDIPILVSTVDLPGAEDVSSICLLGDSLFLGRKNSVGPELYHYPVIALLGGSSVPHTSEVGADVIAIRCSGQYLFMSTNRVGAQFQVWSNDVAEWSSTTVNNARVGISSLSRLAPLGLEITEQYIFVVSQSNTQSEVIRSLYSL